MGPFFLRVALAFPSRFFCLVRKIKKKNKNKNKFYTPEAPVAPAANDKRSQENQVVGRRPVHEKVHDPGNGRNVNGRMVRACYYSRRQLPNECG